jgi:hypothetical protein
MFRLTRSPFVNLLAALLAISLLGVGDASLAADGVAELSARLGRGTVSTRVQAALGLARFTEPNARRALERALGDSNAQVRGAAAAALGKVGNKGSLERLRPLLKDPSPAVQRQVRAALARLESRAVPKAVHVALGVAKPRDADDSSLGPVIERAAQRALRGLPGVELTSKDNGVVELLLEGQLVRLEGKSGDGYYAVSAKVDFVITKMPQRLLRGRMSGAATVHGEAKAVRDRKALRELHVDAVVAATASALTQAQLAIESE